MQKLDFVKNLEQIVINLNSQAIIQLFEQGFVSPNSNFNFSQINPLLFASKSSFDQMIKEAGYSEILISFIAQETYSAENLSKATSVLNQIYIQPVVLSNTTMRIYIFHKSLVSLYEASKNVLLNESIEKASEDSLNSGLLMFQISIDSEGLETERYIQIFSELQKLIEVVSKIVGESELKQEIILLDSGSDTNVGIKTGVETAKSVFLIFKEIWDFIVNHKQYVFSQKNKNLLESLTIRSEIQKKVEEGVLSEIEASEYIHFIKTRTDNLINMKVMPKSIVIENAQIDNRKLLLSFDDIKFLTSGEEKQE